MPLTLLFRHLRESALDLLGGGAAAFMRLGNHAEAEQAASYIGKQHTFVLSQLTATLGGSQTHTTTETESYGITDTISIGQTTGWQTSASHGRGGGSFSNSRSGGWSRTHGHSVSRNWSTALSWAEGTNWSNADTTQRVYEYTVEPTVLQNLPDYALLLVIRGDSGPVLQPVECDPAIITLPRVSTTPLPEPAAGQLPDPARQARGPAAAPPRPPGPLRAGQPQPGDTPWQAPPPPLSWPGQ